MVSAFPLARPIRLRYPLLPFGACAGLPDRFSALVYRSAAASTAAVGPPRGCESACLWVPRVSAPRGGGRASRREAPRCRRPQWELTDSVCQERSAAEEWEGGMGKVEISSCLIRRHLPRRKAKVVVGFVRGLRPDSARASCSVEAGFWLRLAPDAWLGVVQLLPSRGAECVVYRAWHREGGPAALAEPRARPALTAGASALHAPAARPWHHTPGSHRAQLLVKFISYY
ncbi:hypothetical protein AAFF_G00279180 [Aldrovandia affinis]|uniref:Uncharacterized protein n=1 Tax=Aldrovandia affinis TaxID=143900 RepID=A0AAD7SR69_9TELE|nr:hypothetical protein AAFF_G00279180 [Aldrovandia affinis]